MKDFMEGMSVWMVVLMVLALVFVFSGTPDLWDKWHVQALSDVSYIKQ